MRHYLVVLFAVVVFITPWFAMTYPYQALQVFSQLGPVGNELAAVLLSHNAKSIAEIQSHYNPQPTAAPDGIRRVRILLVPGHEPDYGGAEFGTIKERNMTVELARDLQQFLGNNNHYQVFVTRDTASWNPTFSNYFKSDWTGIKDWEEAHKDEILNLIRLGEFHPVTPEVFHNNAPTNVALRLYGIDKWADENDMDIVLHIHFNDYPYHGRAPGKYSGFAIYVPQNEYDNSTTTEALANSIFKRLSKYNAVSDLSGESSGIVQDQDLIAIGAYNSVNAASMLIEYGYIYEPQFTSDSLRSAAIKDLAFQTYLGLEDFFDSQNNIHIAGLYDTLIMPHVWQAPISAKNASSSDIYALQTALLLDGDYPPADKSMNDCPRSGSIGPCTKAALDAFQKKYNISGEEGIVGEKTVEELNKIYNTQGI